MRLHLSYIFRSRFVGVKRGVKTRRCGQGPTDCTRAGKRLRHQRGDEASNFADFTALSTRAFNGTTDVV
jgi:hypothetical protein